MRQSQRSILLMGTVVLASALALVALWSTSFAASATYGYDTQGRVTSITYDDGTVVDYVYDANGNRTGATRTNPPPDTTPPGAPGSPTFRSLTMTSAIADWTAATDNRGVVGYDYRVGSGSWVVLGNVLSTPITGLSPATTYTVHVRARDAASNVGAVGSASFTTPDTAAPSVPTGLSASAPNSNTVNLSWNASSDNVAVTGYRVYRGGVHIADTTSTSYSNGGLSGSTTYSYQVSARDGAGNFSGLSNTVNVTTPDTIAPSAPASLSASAASPSQINLSWAGSSDSGGSGLAGYRIYRNGAHITNTGATTFADTGLAGSTTYSYTVAGYDNAGNTSSHSNTASATTPAPLTATVSNSVWNWLRRPNGTTTMSPNIVVTASGGSGSGYTYAWQYVSGDTETSVVSPNSNSTRWSRSMPNSNVSFSSVWRCLVTDSQGATTYTPYVTVTFTRQTYQ